MKHGCGSRRSTPCASVWARAERPGEPSCIHFHLSGTSVQLLLLAELVRKERQVLPSPRRARLSTRRGTIRRPSARESSTSTVSEVELLRAPASTISPLYGNHDPRLPLLDVFDLTIVEHKAQVEFGKQLARLIENSLL